jgi:hypothetical protein
MVRWRPSMLGNEVSDTCGCSSEPSELAIRIQGGVADPKGFVLSEACTRAHPASLPSTISTQAPFGASPLWEGGRSWRRCVPSLLAMIKLLQAGNPAVG